MTRTLKGIVLGMAGLLFALPTISSAAVSSPRAEAALQEKVRHELVMLPYLSIFDHLQFNVDDGHVTLMGEVNRPILKSDAEGVVRNIEGVTGITNQIKVLPLSSFDNDIRWRVARAVYGYGPLQRYAMGARPPIHIIVDNGNVKLEGVVANETDKNLAYLRANGVFGVFNVQNNLRVEGKEG